MPFNCPESKTLNEPKILFKKRPSWNLNYWRSPRWPWIYRLKWKKAKRTPSEKNFEGKIPEGSEILFESAISEPDGRAYSIPYLVKKDAALIGDVLQDARVTIGDFNEPIVSITFDSKGAREFDVLTAANIGKRMAVVLDGKVYSAPVIRDRISGGRAIIEGTFTTAEANDLAVVLRAVRCPHP